MTDRSALDRLEFRAVDKARWPDFEKLFEGRGSPKYCWCMLWRATPREARCKGGAPRKAAMADRVNAGVPIGLLAYLDNEPVAWCSIAPRASYHRLAENDGSDEGVWSLACFFIVRRLRAQGITHRLIEAAVQHARSGGAAVVEAYPVDADSPSYKFMGPVSAFVKAGFHAVGRAGSRRHIMRLQINN